MIDMQINRKPITYNGFMIRPPTRADLPGIVTMLGAAATATHGQPEFTLESYADEFPGMGWIDRLGVRRPWRRHGLGLALLRHCFGEFYRRGIVQAGLGVDAMSLTGATRLYEKAGMHIFRQLDAYEKELRPGRDRTTQAVGQTR